MTLKDSCLPRPTSAKVLSGSSKTRLGNVVPSLTQSCTPMPFSSLTKLTTSATLVLARKNLRKSRDPSGQRICSVVTVSGSASVGGSGATTRVALSASRFDYSMAAASSGSFSQLAIIAISSSVICYSVDLAAPPLRETPCPVNDWKLGY